MKVGLAISAGAILLAVAGVVLAQRALLFPAPRTPPPQLGELVDPCDCASAAQEGCSAACRC